MKITQLKVNHITEPVGFNMGKEQTFSWLIEECEASAQKEIRLCVFSNEVVLDTGVIPWSEFSYHCSLDLKPRTRYTWAIEVTADNGEKASGASSFETGKMDEEWTAKLIAAERQDRHPIFVKSFEAGDMIKDAKLYISGLGLYEAYLGGQKIGNEYLTPNCNAYDRWVQVQTYDVKDLLVSGENLLTVMSGNGWYSGRFGFDLNSQFRYGHDNELLAELHISYFSGDEEVIVTDESWIVLRSVITFSNIYDGEHQDLTLPVALPEPVKVIENTHDFRDRLSLPVVRRETFRPIILHTPADETVLDFGQEITGVFDLHIPEGKTEEIVLQAAEVLQDECFCNSNLRTAKAEFRVIPDGQEKNVNPHFTFYGFRYLKVTGFDDITEDDITAVSLYSDIDANTKLTTGHELINRLILNCMWGMKDNFLDVPTDCPQRDERMGWTGDAGIFAPTANYFADTYAFFRKFLYDMNEEQLKNEGTVPMVVPAFELGEACAVWGDCAVTIPWDLWNTSGDLSILKERYDSMKAWTDHVTKTDGDNHAWSKQLQLGDWLALDGADSVDARAGGTDEGFIADLYYHKIVKIMKEASALLGKEEEAAYYQDLQDRLRSYIEDEYYTKSGRCAFETQTAMALSITEGFGSNKLNGKALYKLVTNNNGKLKTGFVGTPVLLEALTLTGNIELAYKLLFNEEYPGWLNEVKLGATTIWERWNSLDETGHISSTGMNSLNHYAYGSVARWIIERAAGFRPQNPGCSKVIIQPEPHRALKHCTFTYPSASGTWSVHWELRDADTVHIEVTVPFGCEAVLIDSFSGERFEVKGGTHKLGFNHDRPAYGYLSRYSRLKEFKSDPVGTALLEEYAPHLLRIPFFRGDEVPLNDLFRGNVPEELLQKLTETDSE